MQSAWFWIRDIRGQKRDEAWKLTPTCWDRWIKEQQADDDRQSFRSNGKLTPEQEEIRRLKVENKQLKLEKQILKKATDGLFAKETK